MIVTKQDLAKRYSLSTDEELTSLFIETELSEDAYECIVAELMSRSLLTYKLYKKVRLTDWKQKKEILTKEVNDLKKQKEHLVSEIEKLNKPKKKGLFSLALERRRLEEEARIKELSKMTNSE